MRETKQCDMRCDRLTPSPAVANHFQLLTIIWQARSYKALGVPRNATDVNIKKRKLSNLLHRMTLPQEAVYHQSPLCYNPHAPMIRLFRCWGDHGNVIGSIEKQPWQHLKDCLSGDTFSWAALVWKRCLRHVCCFASSRRAALRQDLSANIEEKVWRPEAPRPLHSL